MVARAFSHSKKQRQADLSVSVSSGQPGLQNEFQDSQGYTEKPWRENKNKKEQQFHCATILKHLNGHSTCICFTDDH